MMAGRNISASYVAFTSARVMATCAVIGQAVGTAAAQCVESRVQPRDLARDARQMAKLRQALLRDDQTIKGLTNQDSLDLARTAKVMSSAEAGAAKAALLLDGHLRDIPNTKGDPAEVHHWAAPVLEGRPAWIELSWDKPQQVREVQITFDSGFKRQLTLSSQEAQNVNLLRAAQPETVKDYVVSARTADGKQRTLATITGNFQRLRRHRFEPADLQSLRIEVQATNGDPQARIFEVRCYA
jgi:hypothetical protein